jgi:uncharacterized protein GlcG (DUF336 family)
MAPGSSIDIAINKALTARAFYIEIAQLAKNSQPGQQFFGIHGPNNGRVTIFAGGIPLRRDGAVIGAIGLSGGTAIKIRWSRLRAPRRSRTEHLPSIG